MRSTIFKWRYIRITQSNNNNIHNKYTISYIHIYTHIYIYTYNNTLAHIRAYVYISIDTSVCV